MRMPSAVQSSLLPDETLLWTGRSNFGRAVLIAALLWGSLGAGMILNSYPQFFTRVVVCSSLLFCLHVYALSGQYYALTDQRAYALRRLPPTRAAYIGLLDDLGAAVRIRKSRWRGIGFQTTHDALSGGMIVQFSGIDDVEDVFQLAIAAQQKLLANPGAAS